MNAPPIALIGLRLSYEAVWLAGAQKLGCRLRHASHASAPVNSQSMHTVARVLHGLSCRKSSPRQQRHSSMFCGQLWNGHRFWQQRNRQIWFCQNVKRPAAHWSHGPEASQCPGTGMSLSQPLIQNHTLAGACRRSGEPGSGQQNRQVPWTASAARTWYGTSFTQLPICRWNRRYLITALLSVELVQDIG